MYGAAKNVYEGVDSGTLNSDTVIDSAGDFFVGGAASVTAGALALAGVAEAPVVGAFAVGYGVGDFVGEHVIDPYLNRPHEEDATDHGQSYDPNAGEAYNPDDDMEWYKKPGDAILDWLED